MAKYPLHVIENYSYSQAHDRIGKTSKCTVFKGQEIFTKQSVALKIVSKQISKQSQLQSTLFDNQVQTMFTLKGIHPNIINVYNAYETENNKYIVMEYCPNGDLQKIVQSQKLTQIEAIGYLRQIFGAYMCLAQNNILHRDLKPANIFVSQQGTLKLADFGYACRGNPKARDCMMKSNINVGTPMYMPPESLEKSIYSFKSDIWAIGVIFYEMLTGNMPWIAGDQEQLVEQIKSKNIQSLIPKNISAFSKEFLMKSLQISAIDRGTPQQLDQLIKGYLTQSDQDYQTDIEIDLKLQNKKKVNQINGNTNRMIEKDAKLIQTEVSDNQQQNSQISQVLNAQRSSKISFWNPLSIIKQISTKSKLNADKNTFSDDKRQISNQSSQFVRKQKLTSFKELF